MSYNQYASDYKAERKRKLRKRIRSQRLFLRERHKQNQREAAYWDNGIIINDILGCDDPEPETEPDWQEELTRFLKDFDSTNPPKEEA